MGSSSLKNPGHKICMDCDGISECPPDCQTSDKHYECMCPKTKPREGLYNLHKELSSEALEVMRQKNEDYASTDDPYRNFRQFGQLGILVRLSDKLARLRTFTERGELSVKDETVRDTVMDAINYLVLFEGYRCQK